MNHIWTRCEAVQVVHCTIQGETFTSWVIIDTEDYCGLFFFSWHVAKKQLKEEECLSSAQDAIWASSSCFHQLPFPSYPLRFSHSYIDLICFCVCKCPLDLIDLFPSVFSPLSLLFPLFYSSPLPIPLSLQPLFLLPETRIYRKSPETLHLNLGLNFIQFVLSQILNFKWEGGESFTI